MVLIVILLLLGTVASNGAKYISRRALFPFVMTLLMLSVCSIPAFSTEQGQKTKQSKLKINKTLKTEVAGFLNIAFGTQFDDAKEKLNNIYSETPDFVSPGKKTINLGSYQNRSFYKLGNLDSTVTLVFKDDLFTSYRYNLLAAGYSVDISMIQLFEICQAKYGKPTFVSSFTISRLDNMLDEYASKGGDDQNGLAFAYMWDKKDINIYIGILFVGKVIGGAISKPIDMRGSDIYQIFAIVAQKNNDLYKQYFNVQLAKENYNIDSIKKRKLERIKNYNKGVANF